MMLQEIKNRLNLLSIDDYRIRREVTDFFENDVTTYLDILNDLEKKIKGDSHNPDEIQDILNNTTFKVVKRGHALETLVTRKPLLEEIKDIFRKAILPWMRHSVIMKRGLEKPCGYPGDCETLQYVYDNKPVSSGIGYYYDRGFIASKLCVSVRNRKDKMTALLKSFLNGNTSSCLGILNIACGSCKEIENVTPPVNSSVKIDLACIDYDESALNFARETLKENKHLNVLFIKEDIISIVKNGVIDLFKGKDLIYSIGLVDYLPDRILKRLIRLCMSGLNPGGKLILSYKDRSRYNPMLEDWLTDWKFIPRNEGTVQSLLIESGVDYKDVEIVWEPSQIIFFTIITKK